MSRPYSAVLFTAALVLSGCGMELPKESAPAKTEPANPAAPAAPPTAVKAEAGVGRKGRGYGEGLVATPAAAYWAAKERIAFEIQIPHALQLYKATNGQGPKTHQEFMDKIIKTEQIKLPELPEGSQYQYFPDREELMVVRPAP
jgi:hypothetical protein